MTYNKNIIRMRNRSRRLFEDDVNDTGEQQEQNNIQQQKNNSTIEGLRAKIVNLQSQIQRKEETFNREKANLQKQIIMINDQLVKLGAAPTQDKNEGVTYKFSKKLYESLVTSKADELYGAIKGTLDKLDDLSYYMDNKTCQTFAKRLLAWLNEQGWNDGQNHWDDFEDHIRQMLTSGSISLSRREINSFISEFSKVLKENTVFGWIFGHKFNRIR